MATWVIDRDHARQLALDAAVLACQQRIDGHVASRPEARLPQKADHPAREASAVADDRWRGSLKARAPDALISPRGSADDSHWSELRSLKSSAFT